MQSRFDVVACHRLGLAASVVVALGGCGLLSSGPKPPSALPPEVLKMIDNRDALVVGADDAARTTPGGTVVDSLDGLAGCWGSYEVLTQAELADEQDTSSAHTDDLRLNLYEFYGFDSTTKQMTWTAYTAAEDDPFAMYVTYQGTYALEDDNRLLFTIQRAEIYDYNAGQAVRFPEDFEAEMESDPELAAEVQADLAKPFEYLVTLQGDHLKLVPVFEAQDGTRAPDENEARVCARLECP